MTKIYSSKEQMKTDPLEELSKLGKDKFKRKLISQLKKDARREIEKSAN